MYMYMYILSTRLCILFVCEYILPYVHARFCVVAETRRGRISEVAAGDKERTAVAARASDRGLHAADRKSRGGAERKRGHLCTDSK